MIKVFLGGTANGSSWREQLKSILKVDFVDPIVEDWTENHKERELKEREICNYILYVITPRMEGLYSIAELVDDSNKRSNNTLFCFLNKEVSDAGKPIVFDYNLESSIKAIEELLITNGAIKFNSLEEIAEFLNKE